MPYYWTAFSQSLLLQSSPSKMFVRSWLHPYRGLQLKTDDYWLLQNWRKIRKKFWLKAIASTFGKAIWKDTKRNEFAKLRSLRAFVPFVPSRLSRLCAFVLSHLTGLDALRVFALYVPWFLRALITRLVRLFAICASYSLAIWNLLLKPILKCSKRKLKRSSAWNLNEKSFWLIFI